jgi:AcrR family transcriptional regulator
VPKISSEAKAERRKQILEAAKVCFARKGYEQASVDDVCECAGLSKGAIYLYFKTKDELIWAIIDAQAQRLREIVSARSAAEIKQALQELVHAASQNTNNMRIEFYTIVRAFSDPTTRSKFLGNINTVRAALVAAVEQLASSKTVALTFNKDVTVELLETCLLGLAMRCAFPELAPRTDQLELMFNLVLKRKV